MRSFKDKEGREWTISLPLGAAFRVQDETNVNLLNPGELSDAAKLVVDDLFLGNVVAALISDQLRAREIDKKAFLDAMDGGATRRAATAFLDEYALFFSERGNDPAREFVEELQKASIGATS